MTSAELEKLALNTKINLEKLDKNALTAEINDVLNFIKALDELDTSNVVAFEHPLVEKVKLREDIVVSSYNPELILENTPKKHKNFIEVPKVL